MIGCKIYRVLFCLMLIAVFIFSCGDDDDDDDSGDGGDSDDDDDDNDNDDSNHTEYDYDVPVQSTSPWPMYRRTSKNNGRSPISPWDTGLTPWKFATGKSMFHESIIDEDGTIYIGSADTYIYAITEQGDEKWRFETGEINDSTAVIAQDGTVIVPSGDGNIYALDSDGAEKWRFAAEGLEGFITWWEGHISMGPDGLLYAGCDDRQMYAINQDGFLDWTFPTFDQVWSCPSFGNEGEIYFGCNDFMIRALHSDGTLKWINVTLGPVASSPALSDDKNTLYVGSFDGFLHALDAQTGRHLWKFPTRDHVYATPSVGEDGTIYLGSADGTMYAIYPDGTQKWAFDTLDPIRSSAAIDGDGNIYFGCGDGKLYCLRDDGVKKWSYDTSVDDRNDLNGSPVISKKGIVIGGESGNVNFVPFDYCEIYNDDRCDTASGEALDDSGAFLFYFTSGGSSEISVSSNLAPTEVLTFRLVVRENGDTLRARISPDDLEINLSPDFAHRVEVSADGNFLSILPEQPLLLDTQYTITIEGDYMTGGVRIGNKIIGGNVAGGFEDEFTFSTLPATGEDFPIEVGNDSVPVLLLKRMAVPQPPIMTTFNQIGFDSYNYFLAPVFVDLDHDLAVMLVVQGTPGLNPTPNYETKSIFPVNTDITDSFFSLSSEGFTLDVTGVSIAMDLFRVSGVLDQTLHSDPLNVYAEVTCSNIEFFGLALEMLGMCNPTSGKLIANGTALLVPQEGDLGRKIDGLDVDGIVYSASGGLFGGGYLEASFTQNTLLADEQLPVMILVNPETNRAESLEYGMGTEKLRDGSGKLRGVRLALPEGYDPTGKKAYVVVNLYPIHEEVL